MTKRRKVRRASCEGITFFHVYFFIQDGWSALMAASFYGHIDVVNVLINAHVDVNLKDKVCD